MTNSEEGGVENVSEYPKEMLVANYPQELSLSRQISAVAKVWRRASVSLFAANCCDSEPRVRSLKSPALLSVERRRGQLIEVLKCFG